MADNLVFGVKIDLQKGVEEALKDGDKALERIEKLFGKHPITIKLRMDNRVARGSSAELTGFKKQLAELTQQWNALTAAERGSAAGAAIRDKFRALRTEAQGYTSTLQAAVNAEDKLANAQNKTASSTRKLGKEYQTTSTYLSRLIQRLAVYASVSYVGNFLTQVREVTAQFELQKISLGAIIQDQERANQLFEEIKTFALKSPVKILDLTKYTKQLAAYKIGVDELFDTTKRLTDISVGLSVPLERIILLYGQIRATGYLRGCLGKGTSVKMFDGSNKKVEDVVAGDAIMGDDGQKRNVLSLVRNREIMYVVKYDGGSFRCNENHILTLYNIISDTVEDVYVLDYLKCSALYKGVKCTNGEYEYFDMSVERDCEDDYFGFEIDGNKRFIIEGNIVTHNSEVRQATEAGIPLVEELAKKLEKANGELVRASDVMDMISKREIPFEMVKEVFEDMTNAGGLFYNMQEKQGNTLYGMWQKLGDAVAIMYDQIGNTSSVNEGMKMSIQTLRYLMLHWKQVGIVVGGVTAYILANIIATKNATIATAAATAANRMHVASLQQRLGALRLEQMNLKSTHIFQRLYTAATISATKAQIGAATSTNVFSKALYGLKAALLSNPLTALAVALTTIIALLMQSESELDKLNSKLQDIDRDYDASGKKSVERFKELVKAVEENVDGSKAQKEALDELDRTYSKILGSEALELDSLKAMGGQYGELIELIEAYNAKKKGEERATAIKSSYATILDEEKDDLMDYLNQAGMSAEKQAEFIQAINDKMLEGKDYITATDEAFKEFANDISQLDAAGNILNVLNFDKLADAWGVGFRQIGGWFGGQGMDYLYNYAHALEGQNKALDENEKKTRLAADAMGVYSSSIDGLNKSFANLDWSSMEALYNSLQDYNSKHPENMISVPIDLSFDPAKAETEYDKLLETSNMKINAIFSVLQQIAAQEGQTIPEEFYKQAKSVVEGNKDFSFIDWAKLEEQFKSSPKALAAIRASKQLYESIAPSDDTVRMFNRKFMTLADNMDVSLDKMQKYLMKSGDNLGEHRKKLSDEVTNLLKEIARLEWTKKALTLFGLPADAVEAKIQESQQTLKLLQSMISTIPDIEGIGKKKKGSTKSDPRLQTLQEIANKMAEVNKEYDELLKKEGQTKALADTQKLFASSFEQMKATAKKYGFKLPAFEVPQTIEDVQKWYKAIMDNIKRLNLKNADKVLIELGFKSDKAAIDKQQKDIEKQLKELTDRISRTKTAKEFYEKILGMTGDYDLAAKVSLSIYGDTGYDLQKQLAAQVRQYFQNDQVSIEIPLDVITADNQINYKRLGEFAEQMKKQLGEEPYKAIKKVAEEGQKDLAKTYEGYLKDLEKAKTYADKRVELARTTATKIREIEQNPQYTKEQKAELKRGYQEREDREAAKLEYEAFKDTPLYVQMFEDLEHASTSTLEMMKSRLEALSGVWGTALDPTQLKEIQSRMNEIDTQLRERNPFKTLKESYQQYRDAVKSVSLQGAVENAGAAAKELYDRTVDYGADSAQARAAGKELKAREKIVEIARKITAENKKGAEALDAAAQIANDNLKIKRGELEIAAAEEQALRDKSTYEDPDQDPKVIAAHEAVEAAKEEVNLAERVAEITTNNAHEAKKWKESLSAAAETTFMYLNAAGDLAHSIADLTAEFGGSEEDVQFWNDIGDAIGNITAGAQDLIKNILDFNVAGMVTSVVTALPKMIIGFSQLFSAGKIKRANKEIKRQQELLEQLEYSYGRLEKMADKLFGRDWLVNQKQQIKALEAEARAKEKQAEAERSKGKKEDKEKTKQYLEEARDIRDQIADMEGTISEKMLGTDLTSAARDFAKAWLDAYKEFGNTADAMSEKFHEMIQNMIVESLLGKVMEKALKPAFDMIDSMGESDFYSESFWKRLMAKAEQGAQDADHGASVVMSWLDKLGINMRELGSEYTGIAKDVAGATSEEINTAAAIGNTLMYYVSPIPRMDENLARVVALMEARGASAIPQTTSAGWTDWQQQAMDNYNAIARNTADTVVECRRAAEACERIAGAFKVKGSTKGLNVFLNS